MYTFKVRNISTLQSQVPEFIWLVFCLFLLPPPRDPVHFLGIQFVCFQTFCQIIYVYTTLQGLHNIGTLITLRPLDRQVLAILQCTYIYTLVIYASLMQYYNCASRRFVCDISQSLLRLGIHLMDTGLWLVDDLLPFWEGCVWKYLACIFNVAFQHDLSSKLHAYCS